LPCPRPRVCGGSTRTLHHARPPRCPRVRTSRANCLPRRNPRPRCPPGLFLAEGEGFEPSNPLARSTFFEPAPCRPGFGLVEPNCHARGFLGGAPDLDLARRAKRRRRLLALPAVLAIDSHPSRAAHVDAVDVARMGAAMFRPARRLLPPVLPPHGVRQAPKIPSSTGIQVARPRGFEPLTFGSVDRRGSARFGSSKPNAGSQVAKKSPESQDRGHYPPRRAAGWPCGRGCLLVTASGTRSVLAPTAARRGPGTYRTPPSRGYFRRCRHGFGLKPRMGQGYEHESTSSRVSRGLPDVGPASRPPAADRTYARDAPELVGARR